MAQRRKPHCHVRRDFLDTDRGVMRFSDVVDVQVQDGETAAAASQSY
jgi:hypothetical protein